MAGFIFFLPIVFFVFIGLAPYYIILGGLKLLQIHEIPRSKVFIFYLSIMVAVFSAIRILGYVLDILKISIGDIFQLAVNNFIYLVVIFLLLKFYFRLSGKKSWQLFLYLTVAGLIFNLSLIFLIKLSFSLSQQIYMILFPFL